MNENQDIVDLARNGKLIEAVKLYRERYGVGLAEAKQAVERMRDEGLFPSQPGALARREPAELAPIYDQLRRGNKIQAIKLYREQTGLGLREAKEAVEKLEVQGGYTSSGKDSRCFIATAAFEGGHAPEVVALRHWRDERLRPYGAGRAFIRVYYRISPPVARLLGRSQGARAAVRWALRTLLRIKTGPFRKPSP